MKGLFLIANDDLMMPHEYRYLVWLARMTSLLAGLTLGLLFIPYSWSWFAPLPLALLFAVISSSHSGAEAFWRGFASGVGFFGFHLAWLPISFAELFGSVGAAVMLPLVLALAVFWGMTAAITRHFAGRFTLLALPFAWVILEFLRGLGALSFTWGALGYALLPTPLIQIADLGGVQLASLLVGLIAVALVYVARFEWKLPATVLGLVVAATIYGSSRPTPAEAKLEVLLVQGSVNPLEKARGEFTSSLKLYERLSLEGLQTGAKPALIVWPEGAVATPPTETQTRTVLEKLVVPAVIGAPDFENGQRSNSAYGFAEARVTGRFDKVKLVPFSEFFPLRDTLDFVYTPIFNSFGLPGLRGTTPGTGFKPLNLGMIRAGTYICYESTFSAVSRMMALGGANLLVNISNDAWFGRTAGAEQHFQMGRVRAIETRRFVARAGNDGITAVIDPLGRVIQRFPRGERAAFRARVGLSDTLTFYVRFGDWVVWFSGLVLIGLYRLQRRKGRV